MKDNHLPEVKNCLTRSKRVIVRVIVYSLLLYSIFDRVLVPTVLLGNWVSSVEGKAKSLMSTPEDQRQWQLFNKGLRIPKLCEVQTEDSIVVCIAVCCSLAYWIGRLPQSWKPHAEFVKCGLLKSVQWVALIGLTLSICVIMFRIVNISHRCIHEHTTVTNKFTVLYEQAVVQNAKIPCGDLGYDSKWDCLLHDITSLHKTIKSFIIWQTVLYSLCLAYLIVMKKRDPIETGEPGNASDKNTR